MQLQSMCYRKQRSSIVSTPVSNETGVFLVETIGLVQFGSIFLHLKSKSVDYSSDSDEQKIKSGDIDH